MKKIILLFLIVSFFFLESCNCHKNSSEVLFHDEETEWTCYLEQFYQAINTEGKYVAFDLRSKEEYEIEHLRQFQNYDLVKGGIEEFYIYIKNNYSNKYIVYIYIESLDDLNYFNELLKTYKQINVYIGEYGTLRNLGNDLFTFDSGPYNCNC